MHLKGWNPKKGRIGKKEAVIKKNKEPDCVGMKNTEHQYTIDALA